VGNAAKKKYQELTPVVHKSISIAQVRILAPVAAAAPQSFNFSSEDNNHCGKFFIH
jgi:hypothetical protein